MLWRADYIRTYFRIRVGCCRIEGAKSKADSQDASQSLIDVCHGKQAAIHSRRNVLLEFFIVGVAAGLDRPRCSLDGILGDMVGYDEIVDAIEIVGHEAVEVPLSAEDIGEQIFIDR